MGRKLLAVVLALQFLVGCTNNGGSASAPGSGVLILPFSSLTLSTSHPLEYAVSNFSAPTNGTGLNLARPTGGSSLASCTATYNSSALSTVDNTLSVAAYNTSNLATSYDLTQDQTVSFGVSYSGPLSFCSGNGLLLSVSCSLAGFTASLASMLSSGSGDLWIVGSDGYGSNALSAKKWNHTLAASVAATTSTDEPHILGIYQGKLYFSASIGGVSKLYRTDGSTVVQVTQFNNSSTDDLIGSKAIEFQGSFYFTASTGSGTFTTLYRLKSDDTVERVSSDSLAASDFAIYQDKLYFSGLAGSPGLGRRKLIRYDGSSLCQLSDIISGSSDEVDKLISNNGRLYFRAQSGLELAVMAYDGSTLRRITNTYAAGDDGITDYVILGSSLFLNAKNNAGFTKLFEITSSQVQQTSNIAGSSANDNVKPMSDLLNLYFTAENGSNTKLYTIENSQIVQISNVNSGDDIFEPIQQQEMYSGELWAEFTNSSSQGILTKITRTKLQAFNKASWYQTLSGISSGSVSVSEITRYGNNYIYKNRVDTHKKLYLMQKL